MLYLSENEFKDKLDEIQKKNMSKERKKILKEEKKKYRMKIKMPTTSKLILFAVFLMCIEIVLFCEYAMFFLGDTSAMYVLIGIPATLVPTVISYYNKSKKENTVGGIVYDMAMLENKSCDESNDSEAKG